MLGWSGSEFDRVSRIVLTELLTRNRHEVTDNNYWQRELRLCSFGSPVQPQHLPSLLRAGCETGTRKLPTIVEGAFEAGVQRGLKSSKR